MTPLTKCRLCDDPLILWWFTEAAVAVCAQRAEHGRDRRPLSPLNTDSDVLHETRPWVPPEKAGSGCPLNAKADSPVICEVARQVSRFLEDNFGIASVGAEEPTKPGRSQQ